MSLAEHDAGRGDHDDEQNQRDSHDTEKRKHDADPPDSGSERGRIQPGLNADRGPTPLAVTS